MCMRNGKRNTTRPGNGRGEERGEERRRGERGEEERGDRDRGININTNNTNKYIFGDNVREGVLPGRIDRREREWTKFSIFPRVLVH